MDNFFLACVFFSTKKILLQSKKNLSTKKKISPVKKNFTCQKKFTPAKKIRHDKKN